MSRCDAEREHFQIWTPSWGVPNRGGGGVDNLDRAPRLTCQNLPLHMGARAGGRGTRPSPFADAISDVKRYQSPWEGGSLVATSRCHDRPIREAVQLHKMCGHTRTCKTEVRRHTAKLKWRKPTNETSAKQVCCGAAGLVPCLSPGLRASGSHHAP